MDLLIKAKSEGYFIRCFYFLTKSFSINIQRVESRVSEGGHSVPEDKIIKRYNNSLGLLPELIDVCDSINVWDNSTDRPYRIFQRKKDQITFYDNPIWTNQQIHDLTKK